MAPFSEVNENRLMDEELTWLPPSPSSGSSPEVLSPKINNLNKLPSIKVNGSCNSDNNLSNEIKREHEATEVSVEEPLDPFRLRSNSNPDVNMEGVVEVSPDTDSEGYLHLRGGQNLSPGGTHTSDSSSSRSLGEIQGETYSPMPPPILSTRSGSASSPNYSVISDLLIILSDCVVSDAKRLLTSTLQTRADNRGDGEVTKMGAGESYRPAARPRSPPRTDTFRTSDRDRRTPPITDTYHPGERRRASRSPGYRRKRSPGRDSGNWRARPRSPPRARSINFGLRLVNRPRGAGSNHQTGPPRRLSPRRDDDRRDRARSPRRDER
jgi:hypothetical protein